LVRINAGKETIKERGVRMKEWSYCGVLLPILLMLDSKHENPSAVRYQCLGVIPVGFEDAGFCRNTGADSSQLVLFEKKISLPNFGTKVIGIKVSDRKQFCSLGSEKDDGTNKAGLASTKATIKCGNRTPLSQTPGSVHVHRSLPSPVPVIEIEIEQKYQTQT